MLIFHNHEKGSCSIDYFKDSKNERKIIKKGYKSAVNRKEPGYSIKSVDARGLTKPKVARARKIGKKNVNLLKRLGLQVKTKQ